jgi:Leucine-rich repeat (LRR) protein
MAVSKAASMSLIAEGTSPPKVSSITIDGCERKPEHVPDLGWKLDLGRLDLSSGVWHSPVFATTSLTALYLTDGGLDSLPGDIVFLSRLKRLFLDSNNLQKLPGNIIQLESLEILSVVSNNLTSIPENMSNLKQLYLLRLGNNDLDDNALIQSGVWELPMLQNLYLRDNKRITKIPTQILQLEHLQVLDTVGCPIKNPPRTTLDKGVAAIKKYLS